MSEELSGYTKLWNWFSLSYASWLTLPRVMMHEMPDEWQSKMADLLNEWDEYLKTDCIDAAPNVQLRDNNGKYIKTPHWLINYRHPDKKIIQTLINNQTQNPG